MDQLGALCISNLCATKPILIESQGLDNSEGHIGTSQGQLDIKTALGALNNTLGSIQAEKDLNIFADSIQNQAGLINSQNNLNISAEKDISSIAGKMIANQNINILSHGLNNDQGQIGSVKGEIKLDAGAGDLKNRSGKIQSAQDLTINAYVIENQSGLISAQKQLFLNSQILSNKKGQIQSGDAIQIVGKDLNNQGGAILTNSELTLNIDGVLDNSQAGTLSSGTTTSIKAGLIDNSDKGQISAKDDLNISSAKGINNQAGTMAANQHVSIKSQGLDNSKGQVGSAQGVLDVDTGKGELLNASGSLQAGQQLNISSNGLNNDAGHIISLGASTILSTGDVSNKAGQIASNAELEVKSKNLNNQAGIVQSGSNSKLNLNLSGTLDNSSAGQIHSGASLYIKSDAMNNSNKGKISAQDDLTIQSLGHLDNQAGEVISNKSIDIKSEGLNNDQGKIGSIQNHLTIDAGKQILSNQSGLLQSKEDLTLNASVVNNTSGQISSQAQLNVISQQAINNQKGLIVADKSIQLISQGLDNNQGHIATQAKLSIDAGSKVLDNRAGILQSGQDIQLKAGSIDNSLEGKISAQESVDISVMGLIDNSTGLISANKDINLNSNGLDNSQGQIGTINGNLNIATGDYFNNQSGLLQSSNLINIIANGLNNKLGQIISLKALNLDSQYSELNNQKGVISSEFIDINSGQLNNSQGLIQANKDLNIDTNNQNLINSDSGQRGGILSQENVSLKNIANLDNSFGYLASGKDLNVSANQIYNRVGELSAANNLSLQGIGQDQRLNNQSGQISSMNTMQLDFDEISNRGKEHATAGNSQIVATNQLSIDTQLLDNEDSLSAEYELQGIHAGNLDITADVVNNKAGEIRSGQNANLSIVTELNNQSGQISALETLKLQGDAVKIDNKKGQLLAGKNLSIEVKSLTGDGHILSLGDADIKLKDNYQHTKDGQLQANKNLSLTSDLDIINDGVINAGDKLQLTATNIHNSVEATIESHDTALSARQQINNTGLINGDYTLLATDTVNNLASGRIYGTDLAISANTLNNRPGVDGKAPVIASRGDMNLGVKSLNNLSNVTDYSSQALIFSAGNLYVGSHLDENRKAMGQSDVINNHGATIESLGNMRLSAKEINNLNTHFTVQEVEVSRVDNLEKFCWAWCNFDGSYIDGNINEDWMKYLYTEIIYETKVLESAPGQIKAGGNLDLTNAVVTNDRSQILAGGELKNEGGEIITIDIKGTRKTVDTGDNIKFWKYVNENLKPTPFEIISTETIDLPISQALGNQSDLNQNEYSATPISENQSKDTVSGSQISDDKLKTLEKTENKTQVVQTESGQNKDLSVSNQDTAKTDIQVKDQETQKNTVEAKDNLANVSQVDQKHGQTVEQVYAASKTDHTKAPDQAESGETFEIRTINSSNIKVPNNALYRISADSQSNYLIETDPAYSDYKKWLSSDYMLNALGVDPALQQKRIGDGFYEQRMVQDQISNLTGYRFLEGYASDEEQYKALMNNGATYAKLYGLRPGIALTAAQIAQITSDIVWLVEQTVILPDGTVTTALVPQVYVKARVGDLKGDGTLLSGNSVNFKFDDDFINTATVAGREAVQISADNVSNLNGRIEGNKVGITTMNDLNNIGGQIKGNDAMALKVGGNLNISTTTSTSNSQVGGFSSTITNIDRVAGLYVGNGTNVDISKATLVVDVGGNTVLKGAQVVNSNGASVITSKGDVDIGTVQTGYKFSSYTDEKNHSTSQKSQDIGSLIDSAGTLIVNGQNINIKGSLLNSDQGTTQVSASDHLNIEEGRKTSELDSQWHNSKKGLLGSRSKDGKLLVTTDEAIGSSINGKNVLLDANNIDIRGSQISADESAVIQAKGDINITAAENYYSNQHEETVKKSGFTASLSDGVASVGYGKSSSNTKSDEQSKTLSQSVVNTRTGDVTIIAGGDLTAEAAILNSGKDLNLQGANVYLNAGYESNALHTEEHSKNSGVSVGVTYSPGSAAQSSYDKNMGNNQYSDSAIGQVMSQGDAVGKAGMAALTPVVITAGSHKSDQKSDYKNSQAVVTQATAKGNLNIIANEGSINSQGALLAAEGDALLHAKQNINLEFARNSESQTANSQENGFSIDNRDWSAPAGIYKNKNQGTGSIDSVIGTQVSVGGKTTMQTEKGDINIIGSSVASQGDLNINSARDVNIKSTTSRQINNESSSNKGIGSAQISDTEKFYGYMNGQSSNESNSVEQQRSQVGSLGGNVNIYASNNYNQQVADVVAKNDINITAKKIEVLDDHNIGSSKSSADDLKVGVFAKVSSPILDLIGAADQAVNSDADDRTKGLQTLAAGAQSYQTYSDVKGGAIVKAEAGIGFSSSESNQNDRYATSQQNNITAGGKVNLTSTEGDIHLQNTQVKAKDTINLDSAKDIILESGQSQTKGDGSNSNVGASIGVGASVGAQTGVYIYGEAGYGKGSNHTDNNIHSSTNLTADQINIKSKGDTTLNGAQAVANRIDADIGGKLSIVSPQDDINQNIKQTGVGGRVQASLGTAWQVSGNYSQSEANGASQGVNQQSGLFAGDGGYHVKADSVDLKGGAIVSTAAKENNDLTANSFTFSDVKNNSAYDATSVTLSGGTVLGGGKGSNPTNNDNWRNSTSFSPSLPQQEKDKDSTTTYATLSDGNITIGGKETTTAELGIHNDTSTAHQKVADIPDLQAVLDQQKTVANATSTIAAAARTYSQDQVQNATKAKDAIGEALAQQLSTEQQTKIKNMTAAEKDEFFQSNSAYAAARENEKSVAAKWGIGSPHSQGLNAITTALTAVLGGQTDLQAASNTLAPYIANLIGTTYGHGEDKNTAAQLTAHAILGGALAYINGGNAAAGAGSAVAAESIADYLTQPYKDKSAYQNANGEFEANRLPEDVKAQIRDLSSAIGAVVGGVVGDSSTNVQIGGVIGQNAVENNFLSDKQIQRKIELIKKANGGKYSAATNSILKAFDTGALTEREAREYLALLAIDNYSDNLIDHYLNNPKNLNVQQLNELKYFLNMASEGNADKVKTIISYAKLNVGDAYPFSSDEMQKAYNKAMYAVSYADSTDYKLAEAGEPTLFGLSGGLGTTIRYAGGLYGAYNIGQGSSKIVDGKYSEGVVQVVGGALMVVPTIFEAKNAIGVLSGAGSLKDANYAQSRVRSDQEFSIQGQLNYSKVAGFPVKNIDDLAVAIKNGNIKLSQMPIDYVILSNGQKLILNTRTSAALNRAGISKDKWFGNNQTGLQVPGMEPGITFDKLAQDQLKRNKLPDTGSKTISRR